MHRNDDLDEKRLSVGLEPNRFTEHLLFGAVFIVSNAQFPREAIEPGHPKADRRAVLVVPPIENSLTVQVCPASGTPPKPLIDNGLILTFESPGVAFTKHPIFVHAHLAQPILRSSLIDHKGYLLVPDAMRLRGALESMFSIVPTPIQPKARLSLVKPRS